MNLEFTAEEEEFRLEVRKWMLENVPRNRSQPDMGIPTDKDMQMAWERRLASKGWLAYTWPTEYGGPGWSPAKRYIFDTERALAGGPPIGQIALLMLGPILMAFGSSQQKSRYLPKIARAQEVWCQGFSEPGAGSDLVSLTTRAVRSGDRYIVNGQKIWTTQAHWADFMFCLVRTNPELPKPQGISFLLIDMKTPGIEIRPIRTIDGHHHLNEVFLTDVNVPIENLVGSEGEGWTIAKYLLTHERASCAGVADSKRELAHLRRTVAADPLLKNDPFARRRMAEIEVDLMALEFTDLRALDRIAKGQTSGSVSSGLKIKGTELQQAISEAQMEFGGLDALPWNAQPPGGDPIYRVATQRYSFLRAATIYGGSNEIQKNLLAKLMLARA